MFINEGYPGDLLAKRRAKFQEQIERQKNIRTGGCCLVWFFLFLFFVAILLLTKYLGWW